MPRFCRADCPEINQEKGFPVITQLIFQNFVTFFIHLTMTIPFFKYQGSGNDFILVDQRVQNYLGRKDTEMIRQLCDRHFGIGADGLILLQRLAGYEFEMVYFNADGNESTMCGNGGRCIAAFAKKLGIIGERTRFLAIDGPHEAQIRPDGWVELKMGDVPAVETGAGYCLLNTGSPHYVTFVKDLASIAVRESGRAVRYSERFAKEGVNVNFVEENGSGIKVATYERGVEDETLSCGTGVTAAAIAFALKNPGQASYSVPIHSKGGELIVRFEKKGDHFRNIWLCGPAELVFEGSITLSKEDFNVYA